MAIELTKEQYQVLVVESKKPVIIDVYAPWCGPCKQMAPHFDTLAHELGSEYNFFKVNVDEEQELAAQFGISSIPTLLFIKEGLVVERTSGFMTAEDIKDMIVSVFK